MQLELFDIQTDNAGRKGKPGKATGKAGIAAAGHKAGATGESGADFLTSLRMVSKKSQTKSEDLPAAATGLDLAAKDPQPTRLGEVLNEIIRAWPTGRRPANAIGAGSDRTKTEASETAQPNSGSKIAETPAPTMTVLEPGKARHSSDRAKQGLDGFTDALMKRFGKPQGAQAIQSAAGPDTVKTAENREATNVAASQTLSTGKRSTGDGIRILNMQNAASSQSASTDGNAKTGAAVQKVSTGADQSTDQPATAAVKDGRQPRVRQTVEPMKANALKGEPQATRQTDPAGPSGSRVNRPTGDEFTGKPVIAKSAAVNANLPKAPLGNSDQPAAAINASKSPKETRPAETIAVKPATVRSKSTPVPLGAKHSATVGSALEKPRMATGQTDAGSAVRNTRTTIETAKTMPAGSSKNKEPGSLPVSRPHAADTPSSKSANPDFKTVPAQAGKAAARAEHPAGERDAFGYDGLNGQTVRDTKGGEQTRFEVTDAKMKPTEPAAATPKAQPATMSTAAPEPEKTVLDRVSEARVLEQISNRIRLQPKNGANEIRIHLKPETLGQMQLKVLAQDQTISVKMVAETAMARDIIENNIGQLRADLNALGLNVEKLDVEVLSTGDPAGKDAAGQRGGFGKHGRGTAHHGGRDHTPGDDQARPTPADEDEDAEGTLIGVFA